jgi:CRP-like cAMP-binding protein
LRDDDGLDGEFLEQVEATHLGRIRYLAQGEVLQWQGDPVGHVFVVGIGTLEGHTLLPDGRAYAHRLLRTGRLAGASQGGMRSSQSMCEHGRGRLRRTRWRNVRIDGMG